MKKLLYIILSISFLLVTCEDHVLPDFGKLTIDSDPTGAAIYKDGENTGLVTPAEFTELLGGNEYEFTLRLNEFADTSFTIDVTNGQNYSEDIFLVERSPKGKIVLTSNPSEAEVWENGNKIGETPFTLSNLERGEYTYTLKLDLYEDSDIVIQLEKDQTVNRNTNLVVAGAAGGAIITSSPSGAEIILDDQETGLFTPDTIYPITAGTHSILLSLDSYRDTTVSINVAAGNILTKDVQLTFYEPRGSITLDSDPSGATILLDGEETGLKTPNTIKKLEAGEYEITLQLEDYFDKSFDVTVEEDKNTDLGTIQLSQIPVYTISASANPSNASTITGAGEYFEGDQVTLTSSGNDGYLFVNWTENGTEVSTNETYTFTASANRTLVANYLEVGKLIVNSDPEGAEIYLDNISTGFSTPHTFNNLETGQYILTLKKDDYADTSIIVNVTRNETTDVGTVFMRDNVPVVEVELDYSTNNSQLIFTFSFNQDLYLDSVVITKPDGSTLPAQNYGGQFIPEGREIDLSYPEKISGIWRFTYNGNKSGGRQKEFTVQQNVTVQ